MAGRTATSKTGTGIVIWFDPKARCGFVKPDVRGPDIFVTLSTRKSARGFVTGVRVRYEFVVGGHGKTEAAVLIERVIPRDST
jgi:cold shock CspA family protein